MTGRYLVPMVACAALLLAGLVGGGDPFARLALRMGLPGVAVALSEDPALRGLALSGTGRHGEAAAAFGRAGDAQIYNRATAHALDGDYAKALLAYDDLLMRDSGHGDGRANFGLLLSIYGGIELDLAFADLLVEEKEGPTIAAPEARGGARAIGDGAESDGMATDIFAPEVETGSGVRRQPKIFDDMFIAATDEWLATMLDQPGEFLAARLLAEQKRRRADGTGAPEEESAW